MVSSFSFDGSVVLWAPDVASTATDAAELPLVAPVDDAASAGIAALARSAARAIWLKPRNDGSSCIARPPRKGCKKLRPPALPCPAQCRAGRPRAVLGR